MKKHFNTYYLTQLIFLVCSVQVFSQNIDGKVLDTNNKPVVGATVTIEDKYFSMTNEEGDFSISVPSSLYEYNIKIESIGFSLYESKLKKNNQFLNIVLKEQTSKLEELVLIAKTKADILREEAYAVEVIESKVFKNLSVNANEVLNKVSGVNIRQSGGLGEDAVLSINGLSGSQVRVFVDGIPMEYFGSSLSLNNFPANLIEQVEVYKGVVPIHLSSDALGGAVNVVTNTNQKNFLDISYSLGSFNTHIASVNGQYRNKKNGFTARLKSFYNYSDNNYKMDVNLLDPSTGRFDDFTTEVERFHDTYKSKMIWGQAGFTKTNYADVLMFGVLYSDNHDQIQQPPSVIGDSKKPFGEVFEKENNLIATFNYSKNHFLHDKLSFKSYLVGVLSEFYGKNISSYDYDWFGNKKNNEDGTGEGNLRRTELTLKSKNILGNINLGYAFSDVSNLAANHSYNFLNLEGEDPYNGSNNTRFGNPLAFNKQVLATSYTHSFFDEKFKNSIFGKYYKYDQNSTDTNYFGDESILSNADYKHFGYGFSSTYFLNDFQFKTSFEHAVRFPDVVELYGDGVGIRSNQDLVPEETNNYNLGVVYKTNFNNSSLRISTNGFIRNIKEHIFIVPGIPTYYDNLSSVISKGVDFSANYNYNNLINFSLSSSYTEKINNEKYLAGGINAIYGDRVPNEPYLYGNATLSYTKQSLITNQDNVSLSISENYVNEFFYIWEALGNSEDKNIIPTQFTTDLDLVYSSDDQTYNISFGVLNVFDVKTYDNLFQQNPKRSFNIKLRYFIN